MLVVFKHSLPAARVGVAILGALAQGISISAATLCLPNRAISDDSDCGALACCHRHSLLTMRARRIVLFIFPTFVRQFLAAERVRNTFTALVLLLNFNANGIRFLTRPNYKNVSVN